MPISKSVRLRPWGALAALVSAVLLIGPGLPITPARPAGAVDASVSGLVLTNVTPLASYSVTLVETGGIAGTSPGLQNAAGMVANIASAGTGTVATVLATSPNGSTRSTSLLAPFVKCVDRSN